MAIAREHPLGIWKSLGPLTAERLVRVMILHTDDNMKH